jgi:Ca-activated chloride channel homolog
MRQTLPNSLVLTGRSGDVGWDCNDVASPETVKRPAEDRPGRAQVVRHALRKAEAKGTVVQIERTGRKAVVSLDAIEPSGRFLNKVATELTLVDPRLATSKLEMAQVAPGRYQAEFDATQQGSYQLMFSQTRESQLLGRQTRGLAVGYPDELRLRPTNSELLRSIAAAAGGRFDVKAEAVFEAPLRTAPRAEPLWPYLAIAALLLFVLDVALRRIDLTVMFPARRGDRHLARTAAAL